MSNPILRRGFLKTAHTVITKILPFPFIQLFYGWGWDLFPMVKVKNYEFSEFPLILVVINLKELRY